MHRLDGHINDIEPRIVAICDNVTSQEEASLQESLSSYGWILLDSWVAWRTLRFILRDADIDDTVHDKWFQTPSSYTASQIKAIWGFSEGVESYLQQKTGKKLKELFDNTIQKKRNASAHFTKNANISGQDARLIKNIYEELSVVFLVYENHYFFIRIQEILEKRGYKDFYAEFADSTRCDLKDFKEELEHFHRTEGFKINCTDETGVKYVISVDVDGCETGEALESANLRPVHNDIHESYLFLDNKGYYQNVTLFADTVLRCWSE